MKWIIVWHLPVRLVQSTSYCKSSELSVAQVSVCQLFYTWKSCVKISLFSTQPRSFLCHRRIPEFMFCNTIVSPMFLLHSEIIRFFIAFSVTRGSAWTRTSLTAHATKKIKQKHSSVNTGTQLTDVMTNAQISDLVYVNSSIQLK